MAGLKESWKQRLSTLSSHIIGEASADKQGMVISNEVQKALKEGKPIVALESTIVSHGMPFPQNLETALAVEEVVRENGATPATIAIIQGVPHIGLSQEQLHHIASRGLKVKKTSRRDLAYVIARKLDGATTVSSTMFLAAKAGITIFVTGGIGGVHRGAQSSFDISSDLTEFTKSPVTVVCAGVKSILDIAKTLEYLETMGVPVVTYQSDEFPAFFTRTSGLKSPSRSDSINELASTVNASNQLGLGTGTVIANPIPIEFAAEGRQIESAISQALQEANQEKILGADITPFLLQRVQQLTGGRSLQANIKLVKNNAALGAKLASALSQQQQS